MTEFYTNLPPKEKDELDKTIQKLTTTNYEEDLIHLNDAEPILKSDQFVKKNDMTYEFLMSDNLALSLPANYNYPWQLVISGSNK